MTTTKPKSLTIRSYQVGFGDCFLLSIHNDGKNKDRHVLIDFGSTGQPKGSGQDPMLAVANDIKDRCNGKLHAVVATHRHKDHISGFATNKKGTASGDVIRSCKPAVVLQPWTEHPDAKVNATEAPADREATKGFVRALGDMHTLSAAVLEEAQRRKSMIGTTLFRELTFLGDDNLSNLSAVKNLMTMGPNKYLNFGSKSGLERILPGVKTRVLGPPTLKQSSEIKIQRSKDEDEFWQFQALANQFVLKRDARAFPRAKTSTAAPPFTRWFIKRMRSVRGEQLLGIVRALDKVMNNTSLILLFEVNGKKLLFPGDAQIENWSYALSKKEIKTLLSKVNVYKVGHHGSRNATPKTLWAGFKNRSTNKTARNRLTSIMSTMPGKHGKAASSTEVPRKTLVEALASESNLFSTQNLKKKELFLEYEIKF